MRTLTFILPLYILSIGFILPLQAQWREVEKLNASDGANGDYFGKSASISGNQAIVGADGEGAGAAYIFARNALGRWQEVAKLTPSDGDSGDSFGQSVAISGNRAIVGANTDDDLGTHAGSAYIFEKDGLGRWHEITKLMASDGKALDYFGNSVSMSGNKVIVGAPQTDDFSEYEGTAYIFEQDASGTWREVAKLMASDGELDNQFGISVAISGNQAIVGAVLDDDLGSYSGSAYIFEKEASGSWGEVTKLTASDGEAGDGFGRSVAISGDRAIVGAEGEDTMGIYTGAAYIFEKNAAGSWDEVVKLTASDGEAYDQFGWSVAISGKQAIVGAHFDDDWTGAAYIFEKDGSGTWREVTKLTASDREMRDVFGTAVSISGNQAVIGAWQNGDLGSYSGSAYIFANVPDPSFADCDASALPGIGDSGNPLGLLDYLCFHIDIKTLIALNNCLHCQFTPCYNCPSPCLTCPAPFEKYGYAYEVTFSYENPLDETIKAPVGKQNYFAKVEDQYVGQPEAFEPGYHENVFSVIAAPGQTIQWVLTDAEGFTRKIEFQMPVDLKMEVYPNANAGIFQLEVNGMEEQQKGILTITKSDGEVVGEKEVWVPYKEQVNISQFGKGLYFVKVATAQGIATSKVMVK